MDITQFRIHALVEDCHWWFMARRQILRLLIRKLVSPGARLVEIGCGTGGNVAAFSDEFACVGIDPSNAAIQLARERFCGIDFRQGDAISLLAEVHAEICLVLDVLEHVENDVELFATLVAASPGAVFIVTVPAGPQLWSGHDVALGHHRRYTMDQFRLLWAELPVECVLCSYFNSNLYPLIRAARFVSAKFDRPMGLAGTDLVLPIPPVNWFLKLVFASEGKYLARGLGNQSQQPVFRWGVSLVAVLKTNGEISNGSHHHSCAMLQRGAEAAN